MNNTQDGARKKAAITGDVFFVVMAGGRGERFWPLSTEAVPKPFISLVGKKTLIELTVERAKRMVPIDHIFIVLGKVHLPVARTCLPDIPPENFIIEPVERDTAPCISLAATIVTSKNPDAVMVVLPSDHFVPDEKNFLALLKKAIRAAQSRDDLITIGITPTRPETGYGYIKRGAPVALPHGTECFEVDRYVEKPKIARARRYIREGVYYWNAGIFVWRARVFLDSLKAHMPGLHEGIMAYRKAARSGMPGKAHAIFAGLEKISIDYGLMEKAGNVLVMPATFSWDDIGTFSALRRVLPTDRDGNIVKDGAVVIDTSNSVIISGDTPVAVIGLSDIVVVACRNGILVCDGKRGQDVRRIKQLVSEKSREK